MRSSELSGIMRSVIMYYGNPLYLLRMRRFYQRWIRPGVLAFDIGAHIGNRSAVWSRMGAEVVAIEPQPQLQWVLRGIRRSTAVLPGHGEMKIVDKAVGSCAGHITMAVSSRHPTVSSVDSGWIRQAAATAGFRRVHWDTPVQVESTTLQDLITQYGNPGFVKVDVEGAEQDVLCTLRQPLRALSFEFLPGMKHRALGCIDLLEKLGEYHYAFSAAEQLRFVHRKWLDAAEMQRYILAREDHRASGDIYAELHEDREI